jgi:membrane-associated phospholipid phosphatase
MEDPNMHKTLIALLIFVCLTNAVSFVSADSSSNLFSSIVRDQKTIWTSPFHGEDRWKWIIPVVATTAFLINRDHPWFKDYKPSPHTITISKRVSLLGSQPFMIGAAGAVYLIGKAAHNNELSRTGVLGLEALIDSAVVVYGLKLATGRERPHTGDGDGSFFEGGSSFPSGHSIAAWSVASAMMNTGHRPLLLRLAVYGAAAAVSVSRVTGENHYPSDVFAGAMMGLLIGRYVARQTHPQEKVAFQPVVERHGAGFGLVYKW